MSSIRLLDDHLINKIAAGEVIERPSSIVKELVENAIDAGSSRINVQIVGGGIELIDVEDNGIGIPAEELELALERHATSKLSEENELYQVFTMGFRGEALPSIASISRLSIHSQAEGNVAMRGLWEGGIKLELGPQPGPAGTRVQVKDIFFNTPVRRGFLKSTVSEQNQIYDIMVRLALSRPDISFSFASEKKLYFKTPGNGDLPACVVSIYGVEYARQYLELEWQGENMRVHGLISQPEFRRSNRKNQLFFINRRSVRSPLLTRALDLAYQSVQLTREYPSAILFMELEPHMVDINVHPQKLEVKFREDQEIFRIIKQLVQARLEQHTYKLPSFIAPDNLEYSKQYPRSKQPSGATHHPTPPEVNFTAPSEKVDEARQFYSPAFRFREPGTIATSPSDVTMPTATPSTPLEQSSRPSMEDLIIIGQLFQGYILIESLDALWVVDQHAAQERILFNHLEDHFQQRDWEQQIMVIPLTVAFEPRRLELIERRMESFQRLGIELELIGPHNIVLRSAPPYFKGREQELLDELLQLMESGDEERFYHEALARMACKASVKSGDLLSKAEMYHLIADLLKCRDYKNCPHGRPLIYQLAHSDLERFFKRI